MGVTSVIAHRAPQLLEVFKRQCVCGIDRQRAFELCLGFGESPQFRECAAQVCMRVGIVWPDTNGGCELLCGCGKVSCRSQCVS